ncbi:hypothetical protein NYO91_07555 [Arhodomonas aquaeolei]|uniref:hypothetical protein n=1 Tax=Arhodomonas aquaeolei TaxID=2369 RepID=UPI002167B2D2|nr:hypothetical protein [Arhodomonas aquaeolei]MCS4503930.1 hypothetical protein [Arhodomonas aquaeolei]
MNTSKRLFAAATAVLAGLLAGMSVVHAGNCRTPAKAAADLWDRYDQVAKAVGCAVGTAGAAVATGGVSLPASAAIYAGCLGKSEAADRATKGMIAAWNRMNRNGWGTIGPRKMVLGASYEGTIRGPGSRMYITPAPVGAFMLDLSLGKRDERRNKGRTEVTVCRFAPPGDDGLVDGEKLWSFTIDRGRGNQGRTWHRRLTGVRGYIVTVALQGKSAVKAMKYRVSAKESAPDHTVVIDGGAAAGRTGYRLVAGRFVQPVDGRVAGRRVSIDSNDTARGRRAEGSVSSGADGFRVYGDVRSVSLDNPAAARVYVDGRTRAVDTAGRDRGGNTRDKAGGNRNASAGGQGGNGTVGKLAGNPGLDSGVELPNGVVNKGSGAGNGGGADPDAFAGRWSTDFGELRLHRAGPFVVGDYADKGVMVGRVSAGCAAGVFTNGGRNGIFRFTRAGDGRFRGQWAWHGKDLQGNWTGRRTGDAPARLRNFTRDGGTTHTQSLGRDVFDGRYTSDYGPVGLYARDLFVVGDYGDKGILAGMWDGSGFVGRFTNGARTGWFDFRFLSKNGDFRSGRWGWVGDDGGGDWSLRRRRDGVDPAALTLAESVGCPR